MDSRERVLAALAHKEAERIPYTDNPWFTTVERWQREGFPKDVPVEDYFDFEMAGFGVDTSFMIPTKIIEETEDYIIEINANGITQKNWKHKTSTPELIARPKWEELKGNLAGSD